jgi:hypothetical protein
MKRRVIQGLVVCLWLVFAGWLIRYEAYPEWFSNTPLGYRHLFARGPVLLDAWMKVLYEDQPIGYTHTRVDLDDSDPVHQVLLNSQMALDMNIMGESQRLRVNAGAVLDAMYALQEFSFNMGADKYSFIMKGRRLEEDQFEVRIKSPAGTQVSRMEIPKDVVIHSPMLEMNLKELKPGKSILLRTLDPATMTVIDMEVKALRRETIEHRGESVETTVLETQNQGVAFLTWMDDEGTVLRQETPFGWTMEACPPEEAMDFYSRENNSVDMLRAMAVPCVGEIVRPRACRRLVLEIEGMAIPAATLQTDRQQWRAAGEGTGKLTVRAREWPESRSLRATVEPALLPYLQPSAFVQSGHPAIKRQAKKIVEGTETVRQAALAIHDWVYKNVRKDPTTSLPSAIDVLHTMRGDCNEHTVLYVALARAAGIPARVCMGVVYINGAFYYHAWPAVYDGQWVELDPTFNQPIADATHLFLVEGERPEQFRLLGVMGNLRAQVKEQGY